jgi:bacillithiol biosynthesis cysteine-adding enzyme BshC
VTSSPPASASRLHLPCDRFLSGLAKELVAGRSRDLLAPLVFAAPGPLPELRARAGDRARIAPDLERANASYGHPRARELSERFADRDALVIVAGQQAGLFGGPLYTLTKMVGATLVAERLERAGHNAVAAFWVATEDHDFTEVARAGMLGPDGPCTLDLGADPAPLEPVGMRTLGLGLPPVYAAARALYPNAPGGDAWRLLESSYRPDARFGEAFSRFMVGLLGERAPLFVDSMLPGLKRAQRPWLARTVALRHEICDLLGAQASRVAGTGHALQVEDDRIASPLFVITGRARRRVLWEGPESFVLRGGDAPARDVMDLLTLLADNPAVVSPGVLLRPIVQDAVLGTALQLMGPGELAYLAQAAPLYRALDADAPHVALRPQMMVLDHKQRAHLEGLGLTLEELLRDERSLNALLARGGVSERVDALRASTLAELDRLKPEIVALDSGLERPLEKTRDQIERALELLGGKASAAVVRRDETLRSRSAALRSACLPGGAPQERGLSTAHFALRYGLGFGAAVLSQLDPESDAVQVIDPEAAVS